MSIQVYVVVGRTGHYDGQRLWYVGAYQNKSEAQQHAELATNEAVRIQRELSSRYSVPTDTNPYDSKMSMDYSGTGYYIIAVDLLDAIPGIDG